MPASGQVRLCQCWTPSLAVSWMFAWSSISRAWVTAVLRNCSNPWPTVPPVLLPPALGSKYPKFSPLCSHCSHPASLTPDFPNPSLQAPSGPKVCAPLPACPACPVLVTLGLCKTCMAPASGVPGAPSPSLPGLPAAEGLPCSTVTSRPLLVQTSAANTQTRLSKPWAAWESLVSQGSLQPSLWALQAAVLCVMLCSLEQWEWG